MASLGAATAAAAAASSAAAAAADAAAAAASAASAAASFTSASAASSSAAAVAAAAASSAAASSAAAAVAAAAAGGEPKPEYHQPGRAFVTFLAGNGYGYYVESVVALAKGLRRAESQYPLVVAVLPDVPEAHRTILVHQGCIVKEIKPVYPPENQTQFAMAYNVISYSKLRIWKFVEYSKMIYLDGDIQVFDNIDHLFDLPNGYFYAVMDCFCEKTWSHTPEYQIGYCQQCPYNVHWPDHIIPRPPLYFNAGMFVYEPNIKTYRKLLKTLRITPPTPFAVQDFLNKYFRDVHKPIRNVYNLVLPMLWHHPEKFDLDKVKVVRYCAIGSKPWLYTGEEENMDRDDVKTLVKGWWDIFHE